MPRTLICTSCGTPSGNPACAACRRPVLGAGPVVRERRDRQTQRPVVGGARATDPRLTTRDVANRLGVSTNFVVEEILNGRLEALVIRREPLRTLYRVSEASLDAYLERHKWTSTDRAERADASHEPQP